jgi:hypothetical protein
MTAEHCFGQAVQLTEVALRVQTTIPAPSLPAGATLAGVGKVIETNGWRTTAVKYCGRWCPDGYFLRAVTNGEACFGTTLDVSGDLLFARFGKEELFRIGKAAPFQYSRTTEQMTNVLKNGFASAGRQAAEILDLATGLGIGDSFELMEGGQDRNDGLRPLSVRLKRMPELVCQSMVAFTNQRPVKLDVIFTNRLKELMGYHYSYSGVPGGSGSGLLFDSVHLVVSNYTQCALRFDRSVKILAVKAERRKVSRADFGLAATLPKEKTWVWVGDTIEGMDKKLDFISANSGALPPAPGRSRAVVIRVSLALLVVAPLLVWWFWSKSINQQKQ